MNDSTVKAIRKLKNGNGDYLWQPSLTAGQPDTLLGRPVYTSSYMPAIAAGKAAYATMLSAFHALLYPHRVIEEMF